MAALVYSVGCSPRWNRGLPPSHYGSGPTTVEGTLSHERKGCSGYWRDANPRIDNWQGDALCWHWNRSNSWWTTYWHLQQATILQLYEYRLKLRAWLTYDDTWANRFRGIGQAIRSSSS